MSAVEKLTNIQEKNKSYICLGLDLDPKKMPPDSTVSIKAMYEFAMNIIEATKDQVCAYKPNLAFYEHLGHDGISLLETIVSRMPKDIPIIMDCKRGDIGNTASFYAEAMFEKFNADWVTLAPYMGYDSMRPFLEYKDKGIFVLCLTSNSGSKDFQLLDVGGKPLYQVVAEKVNYWNKEHNCGLVVGATNPEQLKELRTIAKDMPLLIPGVGAQGGSLEKSLLYGTDNFKKPAVINVSRSVLYASNGPDYAEKAREELIRMNTETAKIKAGEFTESQPEKPETQQQQPAPTEQTTETKTQVQGFTAPNQTEPKQPIQENNSFKKPEPTIPDPKQPTPEIPTPDKPAPEIPKEAPPKNEFQNQHQQEKPTLPTPPLPQHQNQFSTPSPTQHHVPQPPQQAKPVEPAPPVEQKKEETPKSPVQEEPRKTPPPLPTPPPILQPNPEVIRRNREEQERRLKALQEQKLQQQNGNSEPSENSARPQEGNNNQQNHKNNFESRRHNRHNR